MIGTKYSCLCSYQQLIVGGKIGPNPFSKDQKNIPKGLLTPEYDLAYEVSVPKIYAYKAKNMINANQIKRMGMIPVMTFNINMTYNLT